MMASKKGTFYFFAPHSLGRDEFGVARGSEKVEGPLFPGSGVGRMEVMAEPAGAVGADRMEKGDILLFRTTFARQKRVRGSEKVECPLFPHVPTLSGLRGGTSGPSHVRKQNGLHREMVPCQQE